MKTDLKYIEKFYDFNGLWDIPSRCGLKIINGKTNTIVICSELYHDNPGTTVTNWCAQLATHIVKEFKIDIETLIFIEHTPDMGSKLSFYNPTFNIVKFDWDGEKFSNPNWIQISEEKLDELIQKACP